MIDRKESIIGEIRSVCPECLAVLKAELITIEDAVYLSKICEKHGTWKIKIADSPWFYEGLRRFHKTVFDGFSPQKRFGLCLTDECNMNCPICYFADGQKLKDLSIKDIEEVAQKKKGVALILYGAEPTLRKDLTQIIRRLKKYQKQVILYTNGLRLADLSYLKVLKEAGLTQILLQFDGFTDAGYLSLRGATFLKDKEIALINLKKEKIPVNLCVAIRKGVNEEQISKVLDYANDHSFVSGVSFIEYLRFPDLKNRRSNIELTDINYGLVEAGERNTAGKINKKELFVFQKIFYVLMSLLRQRVCPSCHTYLAVRTKDGYVPVSELLSFKRVEQIADKYEALFNRNRKWRAKIYFLLGLGGMFLVSPEFLKELVKYIRGKKNFFTIKLATCCDPFNFDLSIVRHCGMGAIWEMDSGKRYHKNHFGISVYSKIRKSWKWKK